MRLAPNSALLVEENLTFEYDGDFEASFRDIPLRPRDKIDNVQVLEDGKPYQPGGCTSFGCTDLDGTAGVTPEGDGIRIVWHHKAGDETRTFTIRYRVTGAVVAYDDVLDLEWKVWGDQWEDKLDHLEATFTDPALQPREDGGQPRPRSRRPSGATPATSRARTSSSPARPASQPTTSSRASSSRCACSCRASPARTSAEPRSSRGDGLPTDPRRGGGERRRLQPLLQQGEALPRRTTP